LKFNFAENINQYLDLALEKKVDKEFLKWNSANFF